MTFWSSSELGWDGQAFILLYPSLTGRRVTLSEVLSAAEAVPEGADSRGESYNAPGSWRSTSFLEGGMWVYA